MGQLSTSLFLASILLFARILNQTVPESTEHVPINVFFHKVLYLVTVICCRAAKFSYDSFRLKYRNDEESRRIRK